MAAAYLVEQIRYLTSEYTQSTVTVEPGTRAEGLLNTSEPPGLWVFPTWSGNVIRHGVFTFHAHGTLDIPIWEGPNSLATSIPSDIHRQGQK